MYDIDVFGLSMLCDHISLNQLLRNKCNELAGKSKQYRLSDFQEKCLNVE